MQPVWHYALVVCFAWSGKHCTDLRVWDQEGVFATVEACQRVALAQQEALYRRPGWQKVVRGTLCSDQPGTWDGNTRVFTTRVDITGENAHEP